jgi:flagellar biosynthesis protein FliQ
MAFHLPELTLSRNEGVEMIEMKQTLTFYPQVFSLFVQMFLYKFFLYLFICHPTHHIHRAITCIHKIVEFFNE